MSGRAKGLWETQDSTLEGAHAQNHSLQVPAQGQQFEKCLGYSDGDPLANFRMSVEEQESVGTFSGN